MPPKTATATSSTPMRVVILGTGTAIGKTYVSCAIAQALGSSLPDCTVIALKPLESGIPTPSQVGPSFHTSRVQTDAAMLAAASSPQFTAPAPPYWLPEPLSPHLSARRSGQTINIERVVAWITEHELQAIYDTSNNALSLHPNTTIDITSNVMSRSVEGDRSFCSGCSDCSGLTFDRSSNSTPADSAIRKCRVESDTVPATKRSVCIIETAGGVFSPLNPSQTNFDLALSLEAAFWILVAPDRLGVLHDLTTTLSTMRLRGRLPDIIVLSQPDPTDASIGMNSEELSDLGIAHTDGVIAFRGEPPESLVTRLVEAIRPMSVTDPSERP